MWTLLLESESGSKDITVWKHFVGQATNALSNCNATFSPGTRHQHWTSDTPNPEGTLPGTPKGSEGLQQWNRQHLTIIDPTCPLQKGQLQSSRTDPRCHIKTTKICFLNHHSVLTTPHPHNDTVAVPSMAANFSMRTQTTVLSEEATRLPSR